MPRDPRASGRFFPGLPYARLSTTQKLDLYLPEAGDGPFPTVLYFHGGGFVRGSRRDANMAPILGCLERGFALASVDYRLSGEALFPAAVQDAKAAVRCLRANAGRYGLDPDRIAVFGRSAGGYLTAMLAATAGVSALSDLALGHPDVSCAVQAAVDWFGPTDFKAMDDQARANGFSLANHDPADSPESLFLGTPVQQADSAVLRLSNPVAHVGPDLPPILIEHGSRDRLVPPAQSRILHEAIVARLGAGRDEFVVLEGADHGGPSFETDENLDRVWSFLDRNL